jgi:hypothetical protein
MGNFEKHREFCRAHGLALSKHGHAVVWQKEWYQVFRFGEQAHAEQFMQEFGGEPMHPSERGKGMGNTETELHLSLIRQNSRWFRNLH